METRTRFLYIQAIHSEVYHLESQCVCEDNKRSLQKMERNAHNAPEVWIQLRV